MLWTYSERIDRQKYRLGLEDRRQRGAESPYSDERLAELKQTIQNERESVQDFMAQMAALKVPNWVGNGAIQWARDLDLRTGSIGRFFTHSRYAVRDQEVERQ